MDEAQPVKVFIPDSIQGVSYHLAGQIQMIWDVIKAPLIVPLLKLGVYICLAMSLMLFMERLYMGVVIILVKLFWKKPEQRYKYEPIQDDVELGSSNFPTVLVQIPMFNEREVSESFEILSVSVSIFLSVVFVGLGCVSQVLVLVLFFCCVISVSGLMQKERTLKSMLIYDYDDWFVGGRFTRCRLEQLVIFHGLLTVS